MAARKHTGKKNRLMKKIRQNAATPTWVIVKTNRRVRRNPKQRDWRKTSVNVG